jgi:secreted PhoX family phosphatase
MKLALKENSPQKQGKRIENFLRRQEAHQKRKENNIKIRRMRQDRSVSGNKPRNRSIRSKSPVKLSSPKKSPVKKSKRVKKLNAYIEQLREDSDHELADEYESKLNFHLLELKRIEDKIRSSGKGVPTR